MLIAEAIYFNGKRSDNNSVPGDGSFTWVDLVDATEDEIANYQQRFSLNEMAVERARCGNQRPKLDIFSEHSVLVLKTVSFDLATESIVVGEISLFFGNDFMVIVRHGDAFRLRSVRADLESQPARLEIGPSAVLYEVVNRLVNQYLEVCERLAEDFVQFEDMIFENEIPAYVGQLYFAKRGLFEFRRAIFPAAFPIKHITKGKDPHITPEDVSLFTDVRHNLLNAIDQLELMTAMMDAALSENSTLIQVRQNQDMRMISAWVGIGAVPTVIAGIYGMNFQNMPELDWRYGYFIVVGLLAIVSLKLFDLFRKNEWL
jgi:magnesium transporter